MNAVWESKAAASAFRLAVRSPLVTSWLARLDRMSTWSNDEVEAWQRARALKLLDTARRRLPGYRENPAYAAARWEDLPVLTKDDVRNGAGGFAARRVPSRDVTTGGTGGRPLVVKVSAPSFFSEWAHIAYAWRTAGIRLTDPKITFRGSTLGRGFSERPVFYQATYNHLAVSPFHLNEHTFKTVLGELADLRPVAIWGYPSAITPFARWVERTGPHPQLNFIRAVLLASEGAFDWQVDLFRRVFGAQVVRWYGQSEKVAFASGCPTFDGYHVLPTYGLLEVLDGRILGTGFTNSAMPLLRYDTEDQGEMGSSPCLCGLPFPSLCELKGRWDQALLWGKGGEPISTSALNFHDPVFMSFDRFQFRQEDLGRATLLVTNAADANESSEMCRMAQRLLQQRVGAKLTIEVQLTESDALLSRRGKVLTVDQRCTPPDPTVLGAEQ